MKFMSPKSVALLVAAGLIASTGVAVAADTQDPAVARAQAQEAFQSSISTYLDAQHAIINTRRAAHAKALADFQSTLTSVTTDAQLREATDARKAVGVEADAIAKAALAALVRPAHPASSVPALIPTA